MPEFYGGHKEEAKDMNLANPAKDVVDRSDRIMEIVALAQKMKPKGRLTVGEMLMSKNTLYEDEVAQEY